MPWGLMLVLWFFTSLACAQGNYEEELARYEKQQEKVSKQMIRMKNVLGQIHLDWVDLQDELYEKRSQWDQLYSQYTWQISRRNAILHTPAMSPQHRIMLRQSLAEANMIIQNLTFELNHLWRQRPAYYQRETEIRNSAIQAQVTMASLRRHISALQASINRVRPLAEKQSQKRELKEKTSKIQVVLGNARDYEKKLSKLSDNMKGILNDFDSFWDKRKDEYQGLAQ